MQKYDFTLNFTLHPNEDGVEYLDRLYEAGCSDACFGIGIAGLLGAEFIRESSSARQAISSAYENVLAAIPHAQPGLIRLVRKNPSSTESIYAASGCERPFVLFEDTEENWLYVMRMSRM